MKLLRFGLPGHERPGLLDRDGVIRDLSAHVPDIGGDVLSPTRLSALAALDTASLPAIDGDVRLGCPVAQVGKILGIGLNYRAHAAETGATPPSEPLVFSKATTSITGPNDGITLPKGSTKTDWEAELAVIIGTKTQYVSENQAMEHVAGYAVMNDVSERDFQKNRGGQFVKGKSADTFAPLGPWLVTKDEVPDQQSLSVWLTLNGEARQRGTTGDMVFGVAAIISHLSQFMTLMPGDVITTGTPAGVGAGAVPPVFLKPGDRLNLGVDGLGEQHQTVHAWPGPAGSQH